MINKKSIEARRYFCNCLIMSMSMKQQRYKQFRLEGLCQYQAARKAGYSHQTAWKKGKRIETSANVGMARAFEMLGVTDLMIAEKALEGLEATKRYGKDGDVEDKDWATSHKYLETISKMTGRLVDKPLVDLSQHEHLTVIVNCNEEDTIHAPSAGEEGSNGHIRLNAQAD